MYHKQRDDAHPRTGCFSEEHAIALTRSCGRHTFFPQKQRSQSFAECSHSTALVIIAQQHSWFQLMAVDWRRIHRIRRIAPPEHYPMIGGGENILWSGGQESLWQDWSWGWIVWTSRLQWTEGRFGGRRRRPIQGRGRAGLLQNIGSR